MNEKESPELYRNIPFLYECSRGEKYSVFCFLHDNSIRFHMFYSKQHKEWFKAKTIKLEAYSNDFKNINIEEVYDLAPENVQIEMLFYLDVLK